MLKNKRYGIYISTANDSLRSSVHTGVKFYFGPNSTNFRMEDSSHALSYSDG